MKNLNKYGFIAVVVLCCCSCNIDTKTPQKPYVVIGKESDYLTVKYKLKDRDGYIFEVTERDDNNRFVGDTIN